MRNLLLVKRVSSLTKNKTVIYSGIFLFFITGIAFTSKPGEANNLKIIPKNTDGDQLERIMHKMTHDLGVTCSYCHPDTKPGIFPVRVDFETDSKPEKLIARKMMRMTDKLNKKYFGYTNDYSFRSLNQSVLTCNTCHRGLPKPSNMKLFGD